LLSGVDSPTTSNFLTGILNSLIMSALLPFFWSTPTLLHGLFMVGLGTCGMLGHMLLTQAFRHAAPAMLAPFSYGQILFAGMYGYLIFDHMPDSFGVIGIGVICLSGLAVAWGQRKR
jgi:drug/metabolite transporter (DMT)-like permease